MATTDNLVKLGQLQTAMTRVKTELDNLDARNFGDAAVADGQIKFFAKAGDTTPLKTIDLPEELFLDQVKTTFVANFAFSTSTYAGATNPNLDGKPVLVIAVKGDKTTNPTLTYSFINLEKLVDTYTAGNGIDITENVVSAKLDPATDNILTVSASGLKGTAKVAGATQGNIAVFGANGAIVDSGFTVAADADINTMLTNVFGATS